MTPPPRLPRPSHEPALLKPAGLALCSGGGTRRQPCPVPGEVEHVKGAEAVQRVKRWLEGTMRVSQSYTNIDAAWAEAHPVVADGERPFSYDLGGVMRGGSETAKSFTPRRSGGGT